VKWVALEAFHLDQGAFVQDPEVIAHRIAQELEAFDSTLEAYQVLVDLLKVIDQVEVDLLDQDPGILVVAYQALEDLH